MALKKYAACINYWDSGELLPYVVAQWEKCGADVIIVYSNASNYGTVTNNTAFLTHPRFSNCEIVKCEPLETLSPVDNERRKRNYGLSKAREKGYTHFISCDADELYEPFEIDWDASGTVVQCRVYFKLPTLSIGIERTLISFIHKITPNLRFEFNKHYPFAFDACGIRIDPTRQLNINSGVQYRPDIICDHFSYVRKDLNRKVSNSTARANINKAVLVQDFINAKDGYFCQYYQKRLTTVPNRFNIPCGDFLTSSENLSLLGIR